MTELALRSDAKRFHLGTREPFDEARAWGTTGARYKGFTVNVPTAGLVFAPFVVIVPHHQLVGNSVFGAVVGSAIPRTQGLQVDQHRLVLLTLAQNWGEVRPTAQQAVTGASEHLTDILARLRSRAGLPAAEIARMVGIQRRHLYNLADGGSTTAEREQRIRALAHVVDKLFERYSDIAMVRSALLAPIESDLRSFVDLANEGAPVADAGRLLEDYLDERRGALRQYVQTPRRAREHEESAAKAIEDTLDISPDVR